MPTNDEMRCSFCGKSRNQVNKLIQGSGGIYICDECVNACTDILSEAEEAEASSSTAVQTSG